MSSSSSTTTTTTTTPSPNDSILLRLTNPAINHNLILRRQLHNKPHAALSFLLHLLMLQRGFRLVALSESDPPQENFNNNNNNENNENNNNDKNNENAQNDIPPEQWCQNSDLYTFKYKHSQSSMTFVLKCVVLGDKLLIHALAVEDKKPYAWEMDVNEFVNMSELSRTIPTTDNDHHDNNNNNNNNRPNDERFSLLNVYQKLDHIETGFKLNIMNRLVPFLNKDGYDDNNNSSQSINNSQQQQAAQAPQPRTTFVNYAHNEYDDYDDVDYDFEYDPLRIGRPPLRSGGVGVGGIGRIGSGVGRNDLFPDVGVPYFRGGPASGFPGRMGGVGGGVGGGGNLVGPGHPMFGGGVGGIGGGSSSGGGMGIGPRVGGPRPPSVPHGARFDPYGPPGTGRGIPPNRPNPDNIRPPQFDDDDNANPYFF